MSDHHGAQGWTIRIPCVGALSQCSDAGEKFAGGPFGYVQGGVLTRPEREVNQRIFGREPPRTAPPHVDTYDAVLLLATCRAILLIEKRRVRQHLPESHYVAIIVFGRMLPPVNEDQQQDSLVGCEALIDIPYGPLNLLVCVFGFLAVRIQPALIIKFDEMEPVRRVHRNLGGAVCAARIRGRRNDATLKAIQAFGVFMG
ncbi:hypothetical protein D3C77_479710 [compost metagenome]